MKKILVLLFLILLSTNAFADKFWVGGSGNTNDPTNHWATSTGGSPGVGNTPTAADNCVFDASSGTGTVTNNAALACRSILSTGSTILTFIHNAAVTNAIGDATAGSGNKALDLSGFTTYTIGNATTSAWSFISTSATQQTINFNGFLVGNITINSASNGNYAFTTGINGGSAGSATNVITSTAGTVHFDGASDNSGLTHTFGSFVASSSTVRTINWGASTRNLTAAGTYWNMSTTANITFTDTAATMNVSGGTIGTTSTFTTGNKIYGAVNISGFSPAVISGGAAGTTTFTNFSRTGTYDDENEVNLSLTANGTIKVTGIFKVYGVDAGHRAIVWPSSNGIVSTLDITGATLDLQYVDFEDIQFKTSGTAVNLSAITGGSGDAGGNSITGGGVLSFTPATTQTWQTTGAGNVSDVTKWTSRIPLPQDTAVFSSAFTGSPLISYDMKFSLGNVTFAGGSGNVTLRAEFPNGSSLNGNVTLRSGVTLSNSALAAFYLISRASNTFTFAGATVTSDFQTSSSNGGNITFADSGQFSSFLQRSGTVTIPSGSAISVSNYTSNATSASAPNAVVVNGTLNLISSGTVFSIVSTNTFTSFTGTGQIVITGTTASAKTFAGKGNSYPHLNITGGGSGAVIFTGANTFPGLPQIVGGTKTITYPASTTTTFTGTDDDSFGNGSNIITINSSSSGTPATLSKPSGIVRGANLSIKDITATGGASWFATTSTNVSGNTGWLFDSPIRASIKNGKISNAKFGF